MCGPLMMHVHVHISCCSFAAAEIPYAVYRSLETGVTLSHFFLLLPQATAPPGASTFVCVACTVWLQSRRRCDRLIFSLV
jgi:hypothetical protein